MQTYLKTKPVGIQLLLFIGLSVGCMMALMVIGRFVMLRVTGIDMFVPIDVNSTNPQMILLLRVLLLIQFLGLFVI
ncbi:MAG: hypothetical protein ACXVBX_11205, partial [Flavisolibacter sp.]